MRAQFFLFSFMIETGREECSSLWRMILFNYFWLVCSVSPGFCAIATVDHAMLMEIVKVFCIFAYSIVFIFISDPYRQGGVLIFKKKWSFLSIFGNFGNFLQVFEQRREWFILKFQESVRESLAVASPAVFIFFYDRVWLGGVLKLMKNGFLKEECSNLRKKCSF